MLQAQRTGPIPYGVTGFFSCPNTSSCTTAMGSTWPLTEMSTKNLPQESELLTHMADKFTTICGPTVYKTCLNLTGTALPYIFNLTNFWKNHEKEINMIVNVVYNYISYGIVHHFETYICQLSTFSQTK
jgi:hypothetical protein